MLKRIILMIFTMAGVAAGAAICQEMPTGRITGARLDGTITVNAGMDAGFETGDILVVQRDGRKVALAHVTDVATDSATAQVVSTEPGMSIRVGDLAAYQLLEEMEAAATESGPRTRGPLGGDESHLPDVMRSSWKVPGEKTIDYDKVIDEQIRVVGNQPHDREAMIKLADAYFRKAWFEHSIRWYQRAVEEKPRAEDNDKLVYQIVRAYGYLNQPQKQAMYMDFLEYRYPGSIFSTKALKAEALSGSSELRKMMPIVDDDGFQKGGMRLFDVGAMDETQLAPRDDAREKLLLGRPARIEPTTQTP